ncbi:MAG: DUF3048 domain-containing protein [Oscillospiraceae bacterium]
MKKRILAIILSAVLTLGVFASCGNKNVGSSEPEQTAPSSSVPEVPPEPPYTPNPYTGLEKDASFPEGQRGTAIMVNNIAVCRPQRGLSMANILYESKVEGGITRFMALFEDYKNLPDVGPVRSARDQFFRLVMPYWPLYVHVGRSGITQTYIDQAEYGDLNIDGDRMAVTYWDQNRRNQGYAQEHTAYTNGEMISKLADKNGIDTNRTYEAPFFNFARYDENSGIRAMQGEAAEKINITHSQSYRTYFSYNADGGRYMMSQYNSHLNKRQDTVDENNGEQLGFENVFVLFADITTYPYPGGNLDKNGNDKGDPNYQKVDMDFGGVGYYFSQGQMEKIRWFKGPMQNKLYFTDMNEVPLVVNCGKSYIGMVDLDEHDNGFSYTGPEGVIDEAAPVPTTSEVDPG